MLSFRKQSATDPVVRPAKTSSKTPAPDALRVGDLSPRVARALSDQVAALNVKRARAAAGHEDAAPLSETERRAVAALEQVENRQPRGGAVSAAQTLPPLSFTDRFFLPAAYSSAVVAAYVGSYFHPAVMIVGFPLLLLMIVGLCVYLGPANMDGATAAASSGVFAATTALRRAFPPELLKSVSPLVAKSRTDALYYDALALLTDAQTPLDAHARRDVLRQINSLLDSRYDLDRHQHQIGVRLAGDANVSALESELRSLEARQTEAARTGDTQTAESLGQSVLLCQERLASARALDALSRRLDAEREMVHQALASIQLSLTRLRAAPAALVAPNFADIRQTVARIESQTRSIEQAADELRALRS